MLIYQLLSLLIDSDFPTHYLMTCIYSLLMRRIITSTQGIFSSVLIHLLPSISCCSVSKCLFLKTLVLTLHASLLTCWLVSILLLFTFTIFGAWKGYASFFQRLCEALRYWRYVWGISFHKRFPRHIHVIHLGFYESLRVTTATTFRWCD